MIEQIFMVKEDHEAYTLRYDVASRIVGEMHSLGLSQLEIVRQYKKKSGLKNEVTAREKIRRIADAVPLSRAKPDFIGDRQSMLYVFEILGIKDNDELVKKVKSYNPSGNGDQSTSDKLESTISIAPKFEITPEIRMRFGINLRKVESLYPKGYIPIEYTEGMEKKLNSASSRDDVCKLLRDLRKTIHSFQE